jgi:NADH-quinone oxidoreductase subunit K
MIMQVEPWVVLAFCSIIFFIGFAGVLIRRNILVILMCVELMLNAVNLTFVTFSKQLHHLGGQMSVFFIITVAAAESAVGLGLVIAMFRTLRSVDTDEIRFLRE